MSAYPYADASQAVGGLGGHLNQIALSMAQRRMMEQVARQRLAVQQQNNLARQQEVQSQQGYMQPYYQAKTGEAQAGSGREQALQAILAARLDSANKGGEAYGQQSMMQMPSSVPTDQGPTLAGGQEIDKRNAIKEALVQMMRNQMLSASPNPQRVMDAVTQQQAQQAAAPMSQGLANAILTKTKSAVPVGHQGGVYDPTQGQITAVMPQNIPPQNLMVPGTTGLSGQVGQDKPTKPYNILGSLQSLYGKQVVGGYATDPNSQMYHDTTNAISKVISGLGQQGTFNPAPAMPDAQPSGGPVKVNSKDEYDRLPSGARYIDPQGNVGTKQ